MFKLGKLWCVVLEKETNNNNWSYNMNNWVKTAGQNCDILWKLWHWYINIYNVIKQIWLKKQSVLPQNCGWTTQYKLLKKPVQILSLITINVPH